MHTAPQYKSSLLEAELKSTVMTPHCPRFSTGRLFWMLRPLSSVPTKRKRPHTESVCRRRRRRCTRCTRCTPRTLQYSVQQQPRQVSGRKRVVSTVQVRAAAAAGLSLLPLLPDPGQLPSRVGMLGNEGKQAGKWRPAELAVATLPIPLLNFNLLTITRS